MKDEPKLWGSFLSYTEEDPLGETRNAIYIDSECVTYVWTPKSDDASQQERFVDDFIP